MIKKKCKSCNKISIMNKNNMVVYAGGTMHNSCWYCGKSFKNQHKSDIL